MYILITFMMYSSDIKPVRDWLEFNSLNECKAQSKLYTKTYEQLLENDIIIGYSLRCKKI